MSCPEEWNLAPAEAKALQFKLARSVRLQPLPQDFDVLGACDLGYVKSTDQQVAVMLTFRWPSLEPLEVSHVVTTVSFPYIPGLLSFREVPPLLVAYDQLERKPDVLLCDGQGIAHPRKLGIASHIGLCLDIPTVGCAKKRLCGTHEPLELRKGNSTPLFLRKEIIGHVFCSRDGVKPLYISPGHLADFESSNEIILRCLGRYRLPEPLRQAHNTATRLRQELASLA
jgi:deoxyribonuclease V